MHFKSSKYTTIYKRFTAALEKRLDLLGKNRSAAAKKLGIDPRILFSILHNGTSAAVMEDTAEKLQVDLLDLLIEGRNILDNQL